MPKAIVKARIEQPELREPGPNERLVRVAGCKFILPCNWRAGDVLDEETAKFLNAAHHTAVINGFSETRRELLGDVRTTYEDLDEALQGFFDHYKRTTRDDTTKAKPGRTDEERELISFARPDFNRAMKGKAVTRKEYEELLLKHVRKNRAQLLDARNQQRQAMAELTAMLDDLDF